MTWKTGQAEPRVTLAIIGHERACCAASPAGILCNSGEGDPDYIVTWEYDQLGKLVLEPEDDNGDGIPEQVTVYQYGLFFSAIALTIQAGCRS